MKKLVIIAGLMLSVNGFVHASSFDSSLDSSSDQVKFILNNESVTVFENNDVQISNLLGLPDGHSFNIANVKVGEIFGGGNLQAIYKKYGNREFFMPTNTDTDSILSNIAIKHRGSAALFVSGMTAMGAYQAAQHHNVRLAAVLTVATGAAGIFSGIAYQLDKKFDEETGCHYIPQYRDALLAKQVRQSYGDMRFAVKKGKIKEAAKIGFGFGEQFFKNTNEM